MFFFYQIERKVLARNINSVEEHQRNRLNWFEYLIDDLAITLQLIYRLIFIILV